MALTLPWIDPTAAPGVPPMPEAYIRWTGLTIEPMARSIRVTFLVYRDRRAHDAGVRPADSPLGYAMAGAEFDAFLAAHPEVAAMIEGLVYDFAKAQPELANATDAGA